MNPDNAHTPRKEHRDSVASQPEPRLRVLPSLSDKSGPQIDSAAFVVPHRQLLLDVASAEHARQEAIQRRDIAQAARAALLPRCGIREHFFAGRLGGDRELARHLSRQARIIRLEEKKVRHSDSVLKRTAPKLRELLTEELCRVSPEFDRIETTLCQDAVVSFAFAKLIESLRESARVLARASRRALEKKQQKPLSVDVLKSIASGVNATLGILTNALILSRSSRTDSPHRPALEFAQKLRKALIRVQDTARPSHSMFLKVLMLAESRSKKLKAEVSLRIQHNTAQKDIILEEFKSACLAATHPEKRQAA